MFNSGDIVWFIDGSFVNKYIDFGTISYIDGNTAVVDLYTHNTKTLLNGIDSSYISFPTKWKPLPKNWSWCTKLFDVDVVDTNGNLIDATVSSNSDIEKLIKSGVIHKVSEHDFGSIESEIVNGKWRLVKKYNSRNHRSATTKIPVSKVRKTRKEAQKDLSDYWVEYYRELNLSDYDWSVEQIEHEIRKMCADKNLGDDVFESTKSMILSFGNVENIECKYFSDGLKWKYCKEKYWKLV